MVNEIKFSDLQGKWLELAKQTDEQGNKSDSIDTEIEYTIFKGIVDLARTSNPADYDDETYTKLFGSEIKKKKLDATTYLSDKERKDNKNLVKDSVKNYVKANVPPQELMAKLRHEYTGEGYSEFINHVEFVLNMVNATNYNSKKDVEKIQEKVEKQIDADKTMDKDTKNFCKNILQSLVKQAKETQIQKEYEILRQKYIDKKNGGTEFKKYIEDLKKELNTKGSDGKKPMNNSYTKEAFQRVENYAKSDALDSVDDDLSTIYQEVKDKKAVDANTKDRLKAQNKDDYYQKAIDSRKTEIKILDRGANYNQSAISHTNMTKKQIKDELGYDLYKKLDGRYLDLVKNEDGITYDLSRLSDMILNRAGANYQTDQSSDPGMSEKKFIQIDLERELVKTLSKGEIKKLHKFSSVNLQGNDHTPKVFKNVASLASGLLGSITGISKISSTQDVKFKISSGQKDMLLKQFDTQGIKYDVTNTEDGQAMIKILQDLKVDLVAVNILKGLGVGIVTNAVMDLVFGNPNDETSCISVSDYDINDSKYTNPQEYKEYIASVFPKSPEKVKALGIMVDKYYDEYGDDWHAQFQNVIRSTAGPGSRNNPEECRMTQLEGKGQVKPDIDTEEVPDEDNVVNPGEDNDDDGGDDEVEEDDNHDPDCKVTAEKKEKTSFAYKRQGGDSWREIVKAFYPCLEEKSGGMDGKNGAIRKLKIALSYDENGKFNQETYRKLLKDTDLPPVMYLPAEIDGCERSGQEEITVKKMKFGKGKAHCSQKSVGYASKEEWYEAESSCYKGIVGTGKDEASARADLQRQIDELNK